MKPRKHTDFLYIFKRFAPFPIKTEDAGWVFFKTVWIVQDERPVEYLGLLHRRKIFRDQAEAKKYYDKMCDLI